MMNRKESNPESARGPRRRPLGRRRFLAQAGVGAAGLALGRRAIARPALERVLRRDGAPKSLVLVQLGGGNDGLSTIVPHGDDVLYRMRDTTVHAKKDLLRIDDYRAFNPQLKKLRAQFDAGRLAIIEGCGYPEAIRSHFKSLEVWHTARPTGRASGDGWIGRLVAEAMGEDPAADSVVHLGGRAPYSVYSSEHPPVALASPTGYRWFGDDDVYAMGGNAICEHEPAADARHIGRDRALQALRTTLDDATESSRKVRHAAASYRTGVEYPKSRLGASLRDVAALIEGGVGTRVYSVQMGGFDTHTNQLIAHNRLMATVDAALGAFFEDLSGRESAKDVVVAVYSEFGRRVQENGSKGHDHGKAAPMFVWGQKVKGGLHGEHPSMENLDAGDVTFTTDFRSVYATFIDKLFGATPGPVLGGDYPLLDLI